MAGTPIRRAFIARIQERGGVGVILDQIAAGKKIPQIAPGLGVSRPFLADYLRTLPGGRAAVQIARSLAAESAARASLEKAESKLQAAGRGASDAMMWLQSRGGFRQAPRSESSVKPNAAPVYVSERQREMGRLHLEAALKRAVGRERFRCPEDVAPEPGSDPTDALLY
jgi:hypothetical protein